MALIRETGQAQGHRVPPQDVALEMAMLGGIMLSPSRYKLVSEFMVRDAFYIDGHAIIWDMMGRLWKRGTPCDNVAVLSELRGLQLVDKVGGSGVIMAMLNQVPTGANVEHHARKIMEKYQLREVIRACTESVEKAYAQGMALDDLLDFTEETVLTACRRTHNTTSDVIGKTITVVVDDLNRRLSELGTDKQTSPFVGLPTGMHELDDRLCGLHPGQLYILAADPGEGKSSLALNWSYHQAVELGRPVGWISLEMSNWTLSERLIAQGCYWREHLDSHTVGTPQLKKLELTQGEIQLVQQAGERLRDVPIHVCDRQNMTIGMIKHEARTMHAKHGIRCLTVDYLTLVQLMGLYRRPDMEITEWCRQLRGLGKELGIPVVLLSQLTRQKGNRNKRPTLSDLAESAGVERNADCVLFIWDEGKKIDPRTGLDQRTLIIAKNRNGPRGDVPILWYPEATKFLTDANFDL